MTVKELHSRLSKMLKEHGNTPVYHPSAPWGCPYEVERIQPTTVGYTGSKKRTSVIMLDDDVGL